MRVFLLLIGFMVPVFGQQTEKPKSFEQRLGYAYGTEVAKSFRDRRVPIDPESFIQAFMASVQGQELKMSKQEIGKVFQENEFRIIQQQATGADREILIAGQQFLNQKAADPNVKKTPSGLLYEVLTETTGPKPGPTDKVAVKYKGTLIDGTLFDSSAAHGDRLSFELLKVIRGWQEGLQLMSVGSKYKFYVPNYLAYRNARASSKIKPFSTLVFEIELLEIEK